jgi:putative chitinase
MLLKNGSTGEDVKKLQKKLGLVDDGSFGPVTEAKVKAWQSKNGLTPDGIVGDSTWKIMFPVVKPAVPESLFNLQSLKGYVPDLVISQIPDTAVKFGITNTLRLSHFLAQCYHESGGFSTVRENLNYSVPRMLEIFKSDFDINKDKLISESEKVKAKSIVGNQVAIGNFVYANQNGNGNEISGDGYNFRGRGYIQLTGRANYAKFDGFVDDDIVANPDLIATKYPLMSAAFFFKNNNLWSICDKGDSESTIKALTLRVNGGLNGIKDRIKMFNVFYNLLK